MSKNRTERSRPRRSSSAGFTLIEVLVALAIAAMGLGALMAAAGQGLQNVAAADTYVEATRRARTHLDMVGIIVPPVAGNRSGDDGGGFAWQLKITPLGVRLALPQDAVQGQAPNQPQPQPQPPAQAQPPGPPLTLYDVVVTIAWRNGAGTRSVTLQSRRLGRLDPS